MKFSLDIPPVSGDVHELTQWVVDQFERITPVVNQAHIIEMHAEPEKPKDGDIVYADGTDWNPGGGEGFYGRENGAWVKL